MLDTAKIKTDPVYTLTTMNFDCSIHEIAGTGIFMRFIGQIHIVTCEIYSGLVIEAEQNSG